MNTVKVYLKAVFKKKQLKSLEARAKFISDQFKSNDDHPIIWHEYRVSDIPNHPETGGYQTVSYEIHIRLPSNHHYRLGMAFSNPSQFWKRCSFITLHVGSWSRHQFRIQG